MHYPVRSRFLDGFLVIDQAPLAFTGPLNISAPLSFDVVDCTYD